MRPRLLTICLLILFVSIGPARAESISIVELGRFHAQPAVTYAYHLAGPGDHLVTADTIGNIWHWDLADRPTLRQLYAGDRPWIRLSVNWRRGVAHTTDRDSVVFRTDLASGTTTRFFEFPNRPGVQAVSPDEKSIIVGRAGTLYLHRIEDGTVVQLFSGHRHAISVVAFNAEGTRLLGGGNGQIIYVWDVETGEMIDRLEGHEQHLYTAHFVDDRTVVSTAYDRTVRLWNIEPANLIQTYGPTRAYINSTRVSRPSNRVVAGDSKGSVYVWALDSGKLLHEFEIQNRFIRLVNIPDADRIQVFTEGDTLRTYDAETMALIEQVETVAHLHGIGTMTVTASDQVVTGGGEPFAVVFDLEHGHMLRRLPVERGPVSGVAAVPESPNVLIAAGDGLRLVRADDGNVIWHQSAGDTRRTKVAVSPDGLHFADVAGGPVSEDHVIRVRSLADADAAGVSLVGHTDEVTGLTFIDNNRVASVSRDGSFRIWNRVTGECERLINAAVEFTCLALSPTTPLAAVGTHGGTVILFDPTQNLRLATLDAHVGPVAAVGFSLDGKTLLTSGHDGIIHVWDAHTHQRLASTPAARSGIHALTPLPDNHWLSAGFDNTVRRWKVQTEP